jgi:hypothetical protein
MSATEALPSRTEWCELLAAPPENQPLDRYEPLLPAFHLTLFSSFDALFGLLYKCE